MTDLIAFLIDQPAQMRPAPVADGTMPGAEAKADTPGFSDILTSLIPAPVAEPAPPAPDLSGPVEAATLQIAIPAPIAAAQSGPAPVISASPGRVAAIPLGDQPIPAAGSVPVQVTLPGDGPLSVERPAMPLPAVPGNVADTAENRKMALPPMPAEAKPGLPAGSLEMPTGGASLTADRNGATANRPVATPVAPPVAAPPPALPPTAPLSPEPAMTRPILSGPAEAARMPAVPAPQPPVTPVTGATPAAGDAARVVPSARPAGSIPAPSAVPSEMADASRSVPPSAKLVSPSVPSRGEPDPVPARPEPAASPVAGASRGPAPDATQWQGATLPGVPERAAPLPVAPLPVAPLPVAPLPAAPVARMPEVPSAPDRPADRAGPAALPREGKPPEASRPGPDLRPALPPAPVPVARDGAPADPATPIGGRFEPALPTPAPNALAPNALAPDALAPGAPRPAAVHAPASPPTPIAVPIASIQSRAERPVPPRPDDLPAAPAPAVRVEPAGPAPAPPLPPAVPLWTGAFAKPVSQAPDSAYPVSGDAAPLPFADGWERGPAAPHTFTAADPQQARTADAARGPALQIAEALRLGPGTFDITLHPEELGKLTVTVTAEDGKLIVILAAERGDTLDLLRRNADLLASEAAKGGFNDLDLSFADNRHASQGRPDQGPAPAMADATGGTVTAATAPPPLRAAGPMGGGLDLRL